MLGKSAKHETEMERATRTRDRLQSASSFAVLVFVFSLHTTVAAQTPEVVLHTSSNLVLVDVVALRNGLPDKTLIRDNFQLFDNGSPVPIKTFDTGAQSTTRPLALWVVVQCRMPGWDAQGSGLFAGQMSRFMPALLQMNRDDSIGVAHWCDNGDSELDLRPSGSIDDAVAAVEQVLAAIPSKYHDRTGELALQKTLQLIVDATRSAKPQPLPVIVFLYGDYSGMPKSEADHFIDELLETSAVAFGLRDRRSPHIWWLPGEQREVAHYIVTQTGGEYLEVTPETYSTALKQILQQLHFRYELGFNPPALDGKRHKVIVKLTDPANHQHKGVRLRYRAAYVPVAEKDTR